MTFHYVKRFFQEPKNSYFLFGPRGTGKSTLTASVHQDALLIDLRLHKEKIRLSSNPDLSIDFFLQELTPNAAFPTSF